MKNINNYILEKNDPYANIKGFIILKPGFLKYEQDWYDMLRNDGWVIEDHIKIKMGENQARKLYEMHKDKDFYEDLVKYMTSSECIVAICSYNGTGNSIKNMQNVKEHFRNKYGKDDMKNGMHSSDSMKNVKREAAIFFG